MTSREPRPQRTPAVYLLRPVLLYSAKVSLYPMAIFHSITPYLLPILPHRSIMTGLTALKRRQVRFQKKDETFEEPKAVPSDHLVANVRPSF
jgi:hypothetical protein